MSTEYEQLLGATIEHLQRLKARGDSFVSVRPSTLQALKQAPVVPVTQARPTPFIASSKASVPNITGTIPGTTQTAPTAATTKPEALSISAAAPAPAENKPSAAAASATAPVSKEEQMEKLRREVLACVKCKHLVAARKNVVFGVGDIHARLMFVGEAPGADEDAQGEPFVGAAGQLLTKIIQAMGLTRQTVYIGNILKCRPDTPGQRYGNRKPTSDEMKICIPWLERQIDLIRPEVLVALGATAMEGLLGYTSSISRIRGQWQSYRNIPLMPTFHPSYLLRNAALTEKRKVWEDMLQVMTKLGMPISDKQRNYFLKAS